MHSVCRSCGKPNKKNSCSKPHPSAYITTKPVSPPPNAHLDNNYSLKMIDPPKNAYQLHRKSGKAPIIPNSVVYNGGSARHIIKQKNNGEIVIKSSHPKRKSKKEAQKIFPQSHSSLIRNFKQSKSSIETQRKKSNKQYHSPSNQYMLLNKVQANSNRIDKLERQIKQLKKEIGRGRIKRKSYRKNVYHDQPISSSLSSSLSSKSSNERKNKPRLSHKKSSHRKNSQNHSQASSTRCIGRFMKTYTSQINESSQIEKYLVPYISPSSTEQHIPRDVNIYESFNPHHSKMIPTRNPPQQESGSSRDELNPPEFQKDSLDSREKQSIESGQNGSHNYSISSKFLQYSNSSLKYRSD